MDESGPGPRDEPGDEELAALLRPPVPRGARPPQMRYSHQALADLAIEHPELRQKDFAAIFGYTEAWVSTIMTSDAFKALLARRRAEVVNPQLLLSLQERATALATKSMEVLQEKLCASQVSDALALRAFELSAKAVGLGGNAPAPAAPNPAEYLPAIAERLMRLQGKAQAEDATIVEHS